jgi:hypothetical protein
MLMTVLLSALWLPQLAVAQADAPLSPAELKARIPGTTLQRTRDNGGIQAYNNHPDGTVDVTNYAVGAARGTASSNTTGTWSIADDGRYCVVANWGVRAGGPARTCKHVTALPDGSLKLLP